MNSSYFFSQEYIGSAFDRISGFDIKGNNILDILLVLFATLFISYVINFLLKSLKNKLHKVESGVMKNLLEPLSQVLDNTKSFFIVLLSAEISIGFLALSETLSVLLAKAFAITLFLQVAIWLDTFARFFLAMKLKNAEVSGASSLTQGTSSSYWLVSFFARFIIWLLFVLLLLDNLGINITALIAGLGVGGIAVALAVQNILGDLFCSLSILLDKPFEVGDFIVVDDMRGTVEKIGIKSTRVRSISGEQIVVANSDLIQKRVKNFKRMNQRRIVFNFGVTYQTPAEKIKLIPDMLKTIIQSHEKTSFDRAHFASFGDYALLFEVVYFVLSSEYIDYMNIQQSINLALIENFEASGIDFAYPTQTIFIDQNASLDRTGS